MNAIAMLKDQHREISHLFDELQKDAGWSDLDARFAFLAKKLLIHLELEDALFYPEAENVDAARVGEAAGEHHAMRELIEDLLRVNPLLPQHVVRIEELERWAAAHFKEEEGVIFPRFREVVGVAILEDLGEEMAEFLALGGLDGEERRSVAAEAG